MVIVSMTDEKHESVQLKCLPELAHRHHSNLIIYDLMKQDSISKNGIYMAKKDVCSKTANNR